MLVDNLANEQIADQQCCVHFALHGVDCEMEAELSPSTMAHLTKLSELPPCQSAQALKAAGKNSPDALQHREVQRDCNSSEEWLTAALGEIRWLKKKGVWTGSLKSEARGEQVTPHTLVS